MSNNYDIVVFGASSFVGKILCAYLAEHQEAPALKWALAGRSQSKLEAVKQELGLEQDILIADASDANALKALCEQTQLIITTVGPYALYGEPLVKACAETGTDYCDLTGEVQFIRRMIDRYEAQAQQSGARIIHCCGFDSIPSDMGVWYTQQQSLEKFGKPCQEIHMQVKAAKGGLSGGTIYSLMNVIEETAKDPSLRSKMADPYMLCPSNTVKTRQHKTPLFTLDQHSKRWEIPFMMAAINTRVVMRSESLLAPLYGENFRYDEAQSVGSGFSGRVKAMTAGAGLAGFMLTAALPPGRWLLNKLMPQPGEGPSPQAQREGFFDIRFLGRTACGKTLNCQVTGDRDPGYGSTSKMLAQSAICLVRDKDRENCPGGFWTTASGLGQALIERLQHHAGLTFTTLD